MIRVSIADDHAMFVDGIESILKTAKNIRVVDRCFDGEEVTPMLVKSETDVLLLDINLPGINGVDLTKEINKDFPQVRILVLSMYNEESFVTEILKNGAVGYILKNTGRTELVKAIETVSQGETYYSKEVTELLMNKVLKKNKTKKTYHSFMVPKISRREKEILQLIVKEFTTQEIADTLFLSQKTVESHRCNLIAKLNVRNTAGLVRASIEHRLLD
ncbi:MAG: response regulator transcription factor [Saprospiraceae bacterium]|nr:response regulator transcription factor [Saprospiraceae bacterium]HMW38350.1 response regulator transcription factor [Saprospiraceae bacterium]HMX87893.1 response regulator transcription factor [Saprospiraceae bacterium]HMZ39741.1 response regulator transcription factor [Saprospiraceae bacterium]HNA63387.1 response regulator transcription factor [Saprospiraceae bacterium]